MEVMDKLEAIHSDLKKSLALLDVILGASVGSWKWNKQTGLLVMSDETGAEIAKFMVSDSPEMAMRERRLDLE